jgi:hypothetical protein
MHEQDLIDLDAGGRAVATVFPDPTLTVHVRFD